MYQQLPALYLLPAPLGDTPLNQVIPAEVLELIRSLRFFVVEDIRSARRYLSKIGMDLPIDALCFYELNEHTSDAIAIDHYLQPCADGFSVGVLSEAGLPAVADPGARLVHIAHQKKIPVVPLVGPSSLMLALMASGLNGQQFAFHGYLPIKVEERKQRIVQLEKNSKIQKQSQLFIEAPYRNQALLLDILSVCHGNTLLCIACNITLPNAFIQTKSIMEWKKNLPDLHKKPVVFILQAG